jgi:SAM-dependent methyltransferase
MRGSWVSFLSVPSLRPLAAPLPAARDLQIGTNSWLAAEFDAKEFAEIIERDPFPLPAVEDREGYHGERHLDYWLSGYKDYRSLQKIYARHVGRQLVNALVLDWGCASGRVLRHFAYQGANVRAVGVDVKHGHCEWIRRHLDGRVVAFPITILPHLPIPDATFDLVYGFSVLTHIGEFDVTWVSELCRVTKPDGLICVSILGNSAWSKMRPGFLVYDDLASMRDRFDQNIDFSPEFFASTTLERFYISWSSVDPVYNTTGFHSHNYVLEHWGRIARIAEILPEAHDHQDIVVLRRIGCQNPKLEGATQNSRDHASPEAQ